ncbi:hypothetical protein HBI55_040160 [Parastagonospora nodorum]|nr:hypothetical protein HBH61_050890 [Parastagonospora nodorum]KAH5041892.1 hypothetical protein HBI75_042160 [Parastagonospora nodorum]KAH5465339.1 hypothetical protein HBI28_231320 [Parastagonospora nodorum]KAH5639460.1 hypothetical protein HBI22_064580 [Parastagonospora nodorum]KAH5652625.1 hypothetical protein HBI51_067320 [Parastagonospora nodorum]
MPRRKINWLYWPDTLPPSDDADDNLTRDGVASRPDIEDTTLIDWGLGQSELVESGSTVDLLCMEGATPHWEHNVSDEDLKALLQLPEDKPEARSIRMCFLSTRQTDAGWLPGNFSIRPETIRTLRKAGLSDVLLTNLYSKHGNWSRMANQQYVRYDQDKTLKSFEYCYQYRCGWDNGVGYIHCVRGQHRTTYFCINYPSTAVKRLRLAMKFEPNIVYRDFFVDTLVANESSGQWQANIHHRRQLLQKYESQYEDGNINYHSSTVGLHKLSRHWLTLGQDCTDFYLQLKFLRSTYDIYMKTLESQSPVWAVDTTVDICESFDLFSSQCDVFVRWARTYHERTNLRINLLFHLANQRESRTSTEIASLTAKVAEQTQRDSASMITIAAMTMLFLPGTFVSAVLSTTFFDFDSDGISVSRKWWILLAATIPLTILVFCIWLYWRANRLERTASRDSASPSKPW